MHTITDCKWMPTHRNSCHHPQKPPPPPPRKTTPATTIPHSSEMTPSTDTYENQVPHHCQWCGTKTMNGEHPLSHTHPNPAHWHQVPNDEWWPISLFIVVHYMWQQQQCMMTTQWQYGMMRTQQWRHRMRTQRQGYLKTKQQWGHNNEDMWQGHDKTMWWTTMKTPDLMNGEEGQHQSFPLYLSPLPHPTISPHHFLPSPLPPPSPSLSSLHYSPSCPSPPLFSLSTALPLLYYSTPSNGQG